MTYIIIDDELASIEKLQMDLKEVDFLDPVGIAMDYKTGENLILCTSPDIIFLDIEIGCDSGLDLLQEVKNRLKSDTRVIFYSAFDKYMIDAIRISAFDFLLKPYLADELANLLIRIKNKSNNIDCCSSISESIGNLISAQIDKIAIQSVTGLVIVDKKNIYGAQYAKKTKCWTLFMCDKKEYKLRTSVDGSDIAGISQNIVQINPSTILNLDYLLSVENITLRCKLLPPYEEWEVYISRRCYSKLKDKLTLL